MKSFLSFLILVIPTSVVACNAQSTSSEQQLTKEAKAATDEIGSNINGAHLDKKIVLYMKAHDLSGIEKSSKSDAYYYRVLIKVLPKNKYLVQDFFVSGKKFTDPYILTDGSIEYTDNEGMAHPHNYYPREGSRVVWSESGSKKRESHYKNNMPTDAWTEYFENGQKKTEDYYKDGVLHGVSKIWNEQGDLIGECSYKQGVQDGRCYVRYASNPDVYIYDINYKNGNKVGISKKWNIDGSIEYFTFNGPLSLQDIERSLKDSGFKIFQLDITADGVNDLVISRVNDNSNVFRDDELYIFLGNENNKYTLSLDTSNHTSDGGHFFSSILPRVNRSGFILRTYLSSKGYPVNHYYYTFKNGDWYISATTTEGYTMQDNAYYCVDNHITMVSKYEHSINASFNDDEELLQHCPPLPNKYIVTTEKADILDENFKVRATPNYYIKGDSIEAVSQNEDWVKVSYKNGTKFGWIDKRDLKPVSESPQ